MDRDKLGVDEIFLAAVEVPAEKRAAYLTDACGSDADLRRRVERLLAAQPNVDSFLESPAPGVTAPMQQSTDELTGTQIGPYKLLQHLGEGGMGVVYMAEQTEPVERRVALKIIKPGMDTRQVIARFEAERQALALMDHPNIAKVLDAATTASGRPYFVMELVKGVPITKYCDEQHLTPKERLKLFIPICQAVQHAHQKGIIHRDLKPSNVLVALYDVQPVPKVIDFGVAKATSQKLTDKTMFTQLGQVVGTLEYMSPEQAQVNQLDVDTRSDIYSLGVLLYELLTGVTPFDRQRLRSAAFDELLRIIREEEPPRPSMRLSTIDTLPSIAANRRVEPQRLRSLVRGELDWIVMKALDKDRTRRYETANGFSVDIQRYLDDEQVVACPPSAGYRFRKFARRNKAALATASVIAVALIFGMVGTSWQAHRAKLAEIAADMEKDAAEREREKADREAQRAESARRRTEQLTLSLAVDRGMDLCEKGRVAHGMLWLVRALELAPTDEQERALRRSLADWSRRLRKLKRLFEHQSWIACVAFSSDGAMVLTSSADNTARLWDAHTGRPIGKPMAHGAAGSSGLAAAFSPDDTRIVVALCSIGVVHFWDTATQTPVGEPVQHSSDSAQCWELAVGPNGSQFLTGGDDHIARLWDFDTRELIHELTGHKGTIRSSAFSPDGRHIVTGSSDGTARLWNRATGDQVGEPLRLNGDVWAIAFSPDGKQMLTADWAGEAQLWDYPALTRLGPPLAHPARIGHTVSFSPDGSSILTSCWDGNVRIWDIATGTLTGEPIRHRSPVWTVAFSPDRENPTVLTGGGEFTARQWEAVPHTPLIETFRHGSHVTSVAMNSDGSRVLTGGQDDKARFWDADTGEEIFSALEHEDLVTSVALSPDGSQILTGSWDYGARLWDAATGRQIGDPFWHEDFVHHVAFHPLEEKQFLTACGDKKARLWDSTTRKPIHVLSGHEGYVLRVAFSPDGKTILTGSADHTARLWDAASGKQIGKPLEHPLGVAGGVAFSPDGQLLVTAAGDRAQLWDVTSGAPQGNPLQHDNHVHSIAFSPDGEMILTASEDGAARLWDTVTQKPIGAALRHDAKIQAAAISQDGSRILTGGWDNTARLWEAPPPQVEGTVERVRLWTEVITGTELGAGNLVSALDAQVWRERHARLQELGGDPRRAETPIVK